MINNFYSRGYTNLTGQSNTKAMKEIIDATNWADTPVGVMEHWSVSLKTIIGMLLSSRHPMLLWWGNDKVQFYNDSYKQILGVNGKHPAALGQKGIECWPELWGVIEPLMLQVLEGSSTWSENELIPIYRNGQIEEAYWTFGYSSVCDDAGNINGILVICTETTQKVFAEKRVARQISNLFTHAPIAICIFRGKEYEIEMANNKMLEIWDRDEKAVLNRLVFDVFPELITTGYKELLDGVFNSGERFIVPQSPITLKRNGLEEKSFVKFIYEPLRDEDGCVSGVMALAHDVTDLVLAIKKTEDAEEKAIMAIDSAEMGVYEINLDTRELSADERFFKILGLPKKAGLVEVISLMNPKDVLKRKAAYKEALITGKLNYKTDIIYEDNKIHWVKINGKLFYNKKNEAIKILGVIDDITEQKFLERQKDDFLSVASHELKTPITTIKGFGQVAEMMLEKKGDFKISGILKRMDGQLKKLTSLVDNLLDISRVQQGKLELNKTIFDFDQFVREKVNEMEIISPSHTLKKNLQANRSVVGDYDKLGQVLTNLILNSVKYSPGNSIILIQTTLQEEGIILSIRDTGIGIATENLLNIFKQFYRVDNKFGYSGMGIGLYISAEIITRHGGKIWAESLLDQGATFKIWLPFSDPALLSHSR